MLVSAWAFSFKPFWSGSVRSQDLSRFLSIVEYFNGPIPFGPLQHQILQPTVVKRGKVPQMGSRKCEPPVQMVNGSMHSHQPIPEHVRWFFSWEEICPSFPPFLEEMYVTGYKPWRTATSTQVSCCLVCSHQAFGGPMSGLNDHINWSSGALPMFLRERMDCGLP